MDHFFHRNTTDSYSERLTLYKKASLQDRYIFQHKTAAMENGLVFKNELISKPICCVKIKQIWIEISNFDTRKLKIDPFAKDNVILIKNGLNLANRLYLETTSFSKESSIEQIRPNYQCWPFSIYPWFLIHHSFSYSCLKMVQYVCITGIHTMLVLGSTQDFNEYFYLFFISTHL